jgi:hypothetical protein
MDATYYINFSVMKLQRELFQKQLTVSMRIVSAVPISVSITVLRLVVGKVCRRKERVADSFDL